MSSRDEEPGLPVDPARAWRSADFRSDDDWMTRLSDDVAQDLGKVASQLPPRCADWPGLRREQMTTPLLTQCFSAVADELANGKGFALLRGLDASDPEALRGMFWVIGNQLGAPVMQNTRGEVLSEVTDRFAGAARGVDTRGYESNDELRFHADGGDCIGMACVRQAPVGGENGLVSLLAIYNQLLAHHPQHLETLYRGFPLYVRKENGQQGARTGVVNERRIPVFAWQGGRMSAWLNMKLAELAAEVSGNDMSGSEAAALACLEEIAERPDMKLSFRQQPGDVLFVHNMGVMHRRDRYEDDPDPALRRRLYRMWTDLHEPRDVAPEFATLRRGIPGPHPVVVGP
jgi:alpha-ketoglutarate-dependent taurine dioxygenase